MPREGPSAAGSSAHVWEFFQRDVVTHRDPVRQQPLGVGSARSSRPSAPAGMFFQSTASSRRRLSAAFARRRRQAAPRHRDYIRYARREYAEMSSVGERRVTENGGGRQAGRHHTFCTVAIGRRTEYHRGVVLPSTMSVSHVAQALPAAAGQ